VDTEELRSSLGKKTKKQKKQQLAISSPESNSYVQLQVHL